MTGVHVPPFGEDLGSFAGTPTAEKNRHSLKGNHGRVLFLLYNLQVFTSVALFSILISPLNAFPWVLNGLVEAWVSIKRVQQFLKLTELNLGEYYLSQVAVLALWRRRYSFSQAFYGDYLVSKSSDFTNPNPNL